MYRLVYKMKQYLVWNIVLADKSYIQDYISIILRSRHIYGNELLATSSRIQSMFCVIVTSMVQRLKRINFPKDCFCFLTQP